MSDKSSLLDLRKSLIALNKAYEKEKAELDAFYADKRAVLQRMIDGKVRGDGAWVCAFRTCETADDEDEDEERRSTKKMMIIGRGRRGMEDRYISNGEEVRRDEHWLGSGWTEHTFHATYVSFFVQERAEKQAAAQGGKRT